MVKIVYKQYAEQGNEWGFVHLLVGTGPYKVEGAPGTGHNIVAVIDAIHAYKQDHPEFDVENGYQEGLLKYAKHSLVPETIIPLVSCMNYELLKEKRQENAFVIDCKEPLNLLRENIKKNHKEIKSIMKDFDTWAKEQNDYMKRNFDHSFLD